MGGKQDTDLLKAPQLRSTGAVFKSQHPSPLALSASRSIPKASCELHSAVAAVFSWKEAAQAT